jgi:hypothetical protein
MGRISIAATLGWVVAFALGFAALVNASEFWSGATLLLMLVALLASVLGTILRGWRGGGWLGFAVFGWVYLLLLITSWMGVEIAGLSDPLGAWVFEKANPRPIVPASMLPQAPPAANPVTIPNPDEQEKSYEYNIAWKGWSDRYQRAELIGRRLAILAFAGLGSIVGLLLARGRLPRPADPPSPR